MTLALLITVAVLGVAGFVGLSAIKDAMERNSRRGDWAIFVARWLGGSHWTGKPQTDAGFRRKGTKALTQTKFAAPFYYRPRWRRMLRRWAVTFILPVTGIVYTVSRNYFLASAVLLIPMGYVIIYRGWKLSKIIQTRTHHRDWLVPIHKRLAELADVPRSAPPRSWIDVTKDRTEATLTLPDHFKEDESGRERIAAVTAEVLGMEDPEVFWHLRGDEKPQLKLVSSPAPPQFVGLANVIEFIKKTANDVFVIGLGKRSVPVEISLQSDSPHAGASMGSGAGKSVLARFLAAQALYKGAIVVILDTKRISHPWARGLPNVIYADTPELIHETLMWLGVEMERRNEVSVFSTDDEGDVNADVGPRILIVAEELNLTANRLRTYWVDKLGNKGPSPALGALQDVTFAGRQVKMNVLMVGQMLTVRVTGGTSGGGEARENIGVRMLARYTKRNWQMLVPEHAMPLVSDIIGRIQVVASGKVNECQVAFISGAEARKLAVAGIVAELPGTLPAELRSSLPKAKPGLEILNPAVNNSPDKLAIEKGNELQEITDESVIPLLSLADVADQRLFNGMTLKALRNLRHRDPAFPKTKGIRGKHHIYSLVELADYFENRRKR